jgi:hypothetical protein
MRLVALFPLPFLALSCALETESTDLASTAATFDRAALAQFERDVSRILDLRKDDLRTEVFDHYVLVYNDATPEDFAHYAAPLFFTGPKNNRVLWAEGDIENHGGGYLYDIFHHWKPHGRATRMSDSFFFARNGRSLTVRELYQSVKNQVTLERDEKDPLFQRVVARLVKGPKAEPMVMPRVFLCARATGHACVMKDSFHVLELLLENERQPTRGWKNVLGHTISVCSLFQATWQHYLHNVFTTDDYFEDHSRLHLVSLLVRYSDRCRTANPNHIKARFLEGELAEEFGYRDEGYYSLVGHHLESLGRLVDDDRVTWSDEEKIQVREWLALHAPAFHAPIETFELTHALVGVRLIAKNAAKLDL